MKCIRCNTNEGSFSFKVMEVHEEYVSGKSGFLRSSRKPSQKIQSLSEIKEFCVCDACIDKKLKATMNPWRDFLNYYKVGAILLIFGVVILINYGGKDTIYTVGGVLLVMIALMRAYGYFHRAKAKKDQYMKMSENNQRFVSAWECVSESAPRRIGNHSVYYIPVTDATDRMTREDFSRYYQLTPENADEFYRLVHGSEKKHGPSKEVKPIEEELDEREPNTDLTDKD